MMNSQQNKKPIKKFNMSTEIRFAATRFKAQQKKDEWQFIPRMDILSYIVKALETRRLPYNGTKYVKLPDMTMLEMTAHLRSFGNPSIYKDVTAFSSKRIKPVFYQLFLSSLQYKQFNGWLGPMPPSTTEEMLNGYNREEKRHKMLERHHPGTVGWNNFHSDLLEEVHVEAVFDLYSSLLRTMSADSAWNSLLDILSDSKSPYSKLQPKWAFISLIHIRVRGVFNPEQFRTSAAWRSINNTDELIRLHSKFLMGTVPPSGIVASYRAETAIHQHAVNSEMKILRYPDPKHDHSKFEHASLFYYSWKWGVWEQLPQVVRHRIESGCENWLPPTPLDFSSKTIVPRDIKFTMFESAGENVGKGLKKSMEGLLKEQGAVFDEKIDKMGEKAELVGERLTDRLIEKTKELMHDFFSGAKVYTTETIEHFSSKTKDLLGNMALS